MHLPFVALPHVSLDETARAAPADLEGGGPQDTAAFFSVFGAAPPGTAPLDAMVAVGGAARQAGVAPAGTDAVLTWGRPSLGTPAASDPAPGSASSDPPHLQTPRGQAPGLADEPKVQGPVIDLGPEPKRLGVQVTDPTGPRSPPDRESASAAFPPSGTGSQVHRSEPRGATLQVRAGATPPHYGESAVVFAGSGPLSPVEAANPVRLRPAPFTGGGGRPDPGTSGQIPVRDTPATPAWPPRTSTAGVPTGRASNTSELPAGRPQSEHHPVVTPPVSASPGAPLQGQVTAAGAGVVSGSRAARQEHRVPSGSVRLPSGGAPDPSIGPRPPLAPVPNRPLPAEAQKVAEAFTAVAQGRPRASAGEPSDSTSRGASREAGSVGPGSPAWPETAGPNHSTPRREAAFEKVGEVARRTAPGFSRAAADAAHPGSQPDLALPSTARAVGPAADGVSQAPRTGMIASRGGWGEGTAAMPVRDAGLGPTVKPEVSADAEGAVQVRTTTAEKTADRPPDTPPLQTRARSGDLLAGVTPSDRPGTAPVTPTQPPPMTAGPGPQPMRETAGAVSQPVALPKSEAGRAAPHPAPPPVPGQAPAMAVGSEPESTGAPMSGVPREGAGAVETGLSRIDADPRLSEAAPVEIRTASAPAGLPDSPGSGRPDLARHAIVQIAETIRATGERAMELRLQPEELGRVSMTMTQDGAGLSVALAADRADTMDLIRRHIDLLAEELRRLGYASVSFSFEHGGDPRPQRDPEGSAGMTDRVSDTDDAVPAGGHADDGPPTPSAAVSASGMDIRL